MLVPFTGLSREQLKTAAADSPVISNADVNVANRATICVVHPAAAMVDGRIMEQTGMLTGE